MPSQLPSVLLTEALRQEARQYTGDDFWRFSRSLSLSPTALTPLKTSFLCFPKRLQGYKFKNKTIQNYQLPTQMFGLPSCFHDHTAYQNPGISSHNRRNRLWYDNFWDLPCCGSPRRRATNDNRYRASIRRSSKMNADRDNSYGCAWPVCAALEEYCYEVLSRAAVFCLPLSWRDGLMFNLQISPLAPLTKKIVRIDGMKSDLSFSIPFWISGQRCAWDKVYGEWGRDIDYELCQHTEYLQAEATYNVLVLKYGLKRRGRWTVWNHFCQIRFRLWGSRATRLFSLTGIHQAARPTADTVTTPLQYYSEAQHANPRGFLLA